MSFHIKGLLLSDGPSMSSLEHSLNANVSASPLFGSDALEVDITNVTDDNISMSVLVDKTNVSTAEEAEFLVEQLLGLQRTLEPLHVSSTDTPIVGTAKDVFVAVSGMSVQWRAGTASDNLQAIVDIKGTVIGPAHALITSYGVTSMQRPTDFTSLAGQSTIGLPSSDRILNANIPLKDTRNGTKIFSLGKSGNVGFADDTAGAEEFEARSGKVKFVLDFKDRDYLSNSIQVWDLGYSPKRRIHSKDHVFVGKVQIDTELYRIELDTTTSRIHLYEGTAIGTYPNYPTALETFTVNEFDDLTFTHLTDAFIRVRFVTGEYLEIERGKDPVIQLSRPSDGLTYSVQTAKGSTETTSASVNYVELGSGLWVASNRDFSVDTNNKILAANTSRFDTFFSLIFIPGSTGDASQLTATGRNREILKEIS